MEFAGSLGDLGLFIPLVVGMTVACGLDMGAVLIWAGLMNIVTGYIFRQPIPVQPMKAMAAVAIAEGMTRDELSAAGIVMGILLVVSSFVIDKITRLVPKAVVRGIQLGIGSKLALSALQGLARLPAGGWDSLLMASGIILLLFAFSGRRQPLLLYVFLFGIFVQYRQSPEIFSSVGWRPPQLDLFWPSGPAWITGFLRGALPQLPLTLLNSVVAVCALSGDYFQGRGIPPKKMARSVGWMNLVCIPLGGIPMCHGAGGLAAQYRFGARTGASVIMLGLMKILVGLLLGHTLLELLETYPTAILGPMLIFAGIELAKACGDVCHLRDKPGMAICLVTAFFILAINTLTGFIAGGIFSSIFTVWREKRGKFMERGI
jgi:MFS superfamily sulfate permease-like transporter